VTTTGERNGYYRDFEPYVDLAHAMRHAYVYDGKYSREMRKRRGRPVRNLSGHKFLAYSQTHDQVGNRARGDRTSQLISVGRQKIAAALVLCSPYIPLLFQGEEWSASTPFQYFMETKDAALREAVRKGRVREFQAFGWDPREIPDPISKKTFEQSKLRWEELSEPAHAEMLEWYRHLIRLRKESAILTDGRTDEVAVDFDKDAEWFVLQRGKLVVACNLAPRTQSIPIPDPNAIHVVMSSDKDLDIEPGRVMLGPDSVAILQALPLSLKERVEMELRETEEVLRP
jgi:maltooligosyltrehalose trehalohydrolase